MQTTDSNLGVVLLLDPAGVHICILVDNHNLGSLGKARTYPRGLMTDVVMML